MIWWISSFKNTYVNPMSSSGNPNWSSIGTTKSTMHKSRLLMLCSCILTSTLAMDQDSSLPHWLIVSTSQPLRHCIWRWGALLLVLQEQARLKPRRTWPMLWLRLATCSTAPLKWTTSPWETSTRDWLLPVVGVVSMSSTDSYLKCSLFALSNSRQ